MNPIDKAIEELNSYELGEKPSYTKVAEKYGVSRSTLARRHKGVQATRATAAGERTKLSHQQEMELVRYIRDLTKQGLPPTRAIVRNFASCVAKETVGEG